MAYLWIDEGDDEESEDGDGTISGVTKNGSRFLDGFRADTAEGAGLEHDGYSPVTSDCPTCGRSTHSVVMTVFFFALCAFVAGMLVGSAAGIAGCAHLR